MDNILAHGPAPARAHLVVGGATPVLQGFYKRFAVPTLDYRGIGGSAPSTLKGFRMDYLDLWGANHCCRQGSSRRWPQSSLALRAQRPVPRSATHSKLAGFAHARRFS